MCFGYITLNNLSSLATIFGVLYAVLTYREWKDNFRGQKAHEYAIELLKKCKHLQYEIEDLGRARFYDGNNLDAEFKSIEKIILEKINPLFVNIRIDLLVAEKILLKHNDLSKYFNSEFKVKILKPINSALMEFGQKANEAGKNNIHPAWLKETKIYDLFFCSNSPLGFKKTSLDIGIDIINNDFYKNVDQFFLKIFKKLEDNLLIRNAPDAVVYTDNKKTHRTGIGGMD